MTVMEKHVNWHQNVQQMKIAQKIHIVQKVFVCAMKDMNETYPTSREKESSEIFDRKLKL